MSLKCLLDVKHDWSDCRIKIPIMVNEEARHIDTYYTKKKSLRLQAQEQQFQMTRYLPLDRCNHFLFRFPRNVLEEGIEKQYNNLILFHCHRYSANHIELIELNSAT